MQRSRCSAQVKAVNGKPIRNLKELVAEVDGTTDAYLRLDLEYDQVHPRSCRPPPCRMQEVERDLQVVMHAWIPWFQAKSIGQRGALMFAWRST